MKALRLVPVAVLVGLGLVVSGAARAELYKWTDEQGNVTYSQVPPPDREATRIAAPPPPPDNPYTGAATAEGAAGGEKSQEADLKKADAEFEKEQARVNKKNCEIAKRNLDIYTRYGRVRNEKNEVVDLDEKSKAAKIREAEAGIKAYCQ